MIYLIAIVTLITLIYFLSITWIIIGFNKIKDKGKIELKSSKLRNISVIVPVRNETDNIVSCLNSLKNQNYDSTNYEVIIVNDHSSDNTEAIVQNYIDNNELDISFFSLVEVSSKKEALKFGIEKASYGIIATTDADCVVPKNWLINISFQFTEETSMLLGPVIFEKNKGFLSAFQVLDMMAIQGMEYGTIYYNNPILNNAANLSYEKIAYKEVGGFDQYNTPSGDDVFLLEKFRSKNKKVKGLLKEDFIVETQSENTLKGFLHQRLRWSSKTKYYKSTLLIYLSAIVLIQNCSLIFIYVGIPLVEKYSGFLTILLFCKWLIDFILLHLVAAFFKRRKALLYFIPIQVVYPIYIVVIWIVSMTMNFEWKGRKF